MLPSKLSSLQYYLSDRHLSKDIKTTKKFNALYIPSLYLAPLLSLYIPTTALAAPYENSLSSNVQTFNAEQFAERQEVAEQNNGINEMTSDDMPTVTLDAITVNVRGIEEDELKTPFVVDTIDAQEIEDKQYVTVTDALRDVPSIDIHDGGNVGYSTLWMRGTGSLSITSLDDNSVDVRIDGISNGKTGLARNLIDVEKVEVAKGPQGTLLGSSAEAGGIIIKTFDPSDYTEGRVSVGVGNHNLKRGEAMLNLPITDNVSFRIAGMLEERDNSLIKREDGKPLNKKDKQGIQAKLRWHDDNEDNNVVLTAYHDEQTNNVPVLQKDFDTYKVATFNLPHENTNTAKGMNLVVNSTAFDFADIESKTGYHHYDSDILRPYLPPEMLSLQFSGYRIPEDQQPIFSEVLTHPDNNRQYLEESIKQVSQEITLVSKPESEVQWVAGLYFANKDRVWKNDARMNLNDMPDGLLKNSTLGSANNAITDKTFDTQTKAIFGEITYPATESLDVIAGLRLANEEQTHDAVWQGNDNNPLGNDVKSGSKTLEDTATTGRFGLSYAISPNWRVYALQSRGHKFGGFADYDNNMAYGNPLAYYKPTTIDASEIGTKYRSADNRLNLGLALYRNKMKDDHMSVTASPPEYKSETFNVDSRSQGIELSADWRMTNNWQIKTQLAYTDAKVTDASEVPPPARPGMLPLTAEDNHMPQVPKFSGSISMQYNDDLLFTLPVFGKAQWFADAKYRYVGDRYAQAYNGIELESYGLVDASLGLTSYNHELSIWGKNLTDERYEHIKIYPMNVGILGTDRSYGLKYSYYY